MHFHPGDINRIARKSTNKIHAKNDDDGDDGDDAAATAATEKGTDARQQLTLVSDMSAIDEDTEKRI